VRSLNLPNAITLARIALVPVVVITMLDARRGASPILPAALVVVAALSDALDGYLARRTNEVTEFGRIVDPIADKALTAAALTVLAVQGRVAVWVAVAIVGRELAVTALRSVAGRRGITVSVSRLGKNKTTLQVVAIVTLILTVVSGAEYFTGLRSRPGDEPGPPERSSSPRG
jgi:CDP-diacylglycerol--glycerol-3-phosphate 3-phosphatidyltransferase